jgi:V8-like Glu-specific endopeptidase
MAAALTFGSAAPATADPGYLAPPEALNPTGTGPLDAAGATTALGGEGRDARTPSAKRTSQTVRRCVTRRSMRTCRSYRGVRVVRICVKRTANRAAGRRAGRERCRTVRASAAVKLSSGYESSIAPAIGRSYYHGPGNSVPYGGWCSGAFIGNGLFLTAAHCLYDDGESGGRPGAYDKSKMTVVPGNTVSAQGTPASNQGTYAVAENYFPVGYMQGDTSLDWGITLVRPNAAGYYPGQYTGTYTATAGVTLPAGAPIYSVGYPASGLFRTPNYFYGAGQYFCNNTFDGNGWWDYGNAANRLDAGVWVYYTCEMTGGSSGGPVFTRFANGAWSVFGVVNRGQDTRAQTAFYTGIVQLTSMFDNRFTEFYNSVLNSINGARTSSTSLRHPEARATTGRR